MYILLLLFLSFVGGTPQPQLGISRSTDQDHTEKIGDFIFKSSGRSEESLKTLKLVQFIFRHGDRNSIFPLKSPLIVNVPPVGIGQLTEKGKAQMLELGQMLRARYDGFLSRRYDLDQILVKAMDKDRCIMSANALLSKLFPDPMSFVPVHSISREVDNILSVERFRCPRYQQLLAAQMEKISAEALKNQKSSWKALARVMNMSVENFQDAGMIDENLIVMENHGLRLPAGISPALLNLMLDNFEAKRLARVATPEMEELYTGPLFAELVGNMEGRLNGSSSRRSYGFAGTDFVLSGFLHTLRLYKDTPPPFAAVIIIELHQEGKHEAEVKVFYRTDTRVPPVELQNSACGQPCLLSRLRAAYTQLINVTNHYEDRCRAQ